MELTYRVNMRSRDADICLVWITWSTDLDSTLYVQNFNKEDCLPTAFMYSSKLSDDSSLHLPTKAAIFAGVKGDDLTARC